MFEEPGNTYVNTLRATSASQDAVALRIRLQRALAGARLHPTGLPASAILCVSKLRDPLPGGLRIEGGSLQAPPAWERAVAESLEQLARRAVRPALSYVPINADAVVFLDRSELLACFASDWLDGSAASRWWWRSVFQTVDMTAFIRAWMEAPEYGPAALELLARKVEAAQFVSLFGEADARSLLSAITDRFALHELATAIKAVMKGRGANESMPEMNTSRLPERGPTSSTRPASAPWKRWVKETEDVQLRVSQETLLATGLMLVRAPAVVRSRSFPEKLIEWYGIEDATTRSSDARAGGELERALEKAADQGAPEKSDSARDLEAEALGRHADETFVAALVQFAEPEAAPLNQIIVATADASVPPPPLRATEIVTNKSSSRTLQRLASSATARESGQAALSALDQSIQFASETEPIDVLFEAEIETEFGGVFYLINVGLFLNLYGDFTTPLQRGIDLPIWDFVALIGQSLSGGKIESDPVWPLLARLAGRAEDERPGADFHPPDSWRMPDDWLASFEREGIWRFETSDNRLRVWSAEEFLVVDTPREGDLRQQLARDLKGFKGITRFEPRVEPSTAGSSSSKLQRWLGWLTPYLRARLGRAFGTLEPDDAQRVLLEHHARIAVTATHIDVSFSLEKHPVEIRLAGLDRDPGWVPAAGRYITFHYD